MVNSIQKIKVHECAIPFMKPNSSQVESNAPRVESNRAESNTTRVEYTSNRIECRVHSIVLESNGTTIRTRKIESNRVESRISNIR
jgi:hypothetical protein